MHVFICLIQRFTPSVSPRKITRNGRLRTNLVLLRVQGELLSNTCCWCPLSVNQACTPRSRPLKTYTSAAQLTLDFCREKDEFFISEILQLKINKTIPLRLAPPSRLYHPLFAGGRINERGSRGSAANTRRLRTAAPRSGAGAPGHGRCTQEVREPGAGTRREAAAGAASRGAAGGPAGRSLCPAARPAGGPGHGEAAGRGHFRGQARRRGAPTPRREPGAERGAGSAAAPRWNQTGGGAVTDPRPASLRSASARLPSFARSAILLPQSRPRCIAQPGGLHCPPAPPGGACATSRPARGGSARAPLGGRGEREGGGDGGGVVTGCWALPRVRTAGAGRVPQVRRLLQSRQCGVVGGGGGCGVWGCLSASCTCP